MNCSRIRVLYDHSPWIVETPRAVPARTSWPKTMAPFMRHKKKPLSSGRTFSPIQTGDRIYTIPNPIAAHMSVLDISEWFCCLPLTKRPHKNKIHSWLANCMPIPTAVITVPISNECLRPIHSINCPAIRIPMMSPPVAAPDQPDRYLAGMR